MSLIPWFIIFQLLGVLFFSSIFLTVGASISELKEAQGLLMPIWLVMLAPMMIWIVVLRDPNGAVAVGMSLFPPSAPLMMMLRLASGQTIPWWQPPVSAGILVAATILVVMGAGRIYRASLLRARFGPHANAVPGAVAWVVISFFVTPFFVRSIGQKIK